MLENDEVLPTGSYHCADCSWLMDALREVEKQYREADDELNRKVTLAPSPGSQESSDLARVLEEKILKLKCRRDCALDVLLKHQALEHR